MGIDKSKNMIKRAESKRASKKEKYTCTNLESWNYAGKFDVVFSMESLYYSVPMETKLRFSRCSKLAVSFTVEPTFTVTTISPRDGKKL